MNRRDALKSLAAIAGASGITVTPVTTHEATDITMVILRSDRPFSAQERENLSHVWEVACQGTALQGVKTLMLDSSLNIEIVRVRA